DEGRAAPSRTDGRAARTPELTRPPQAVRELVRRRAVGGGALEGALDDGEQSARQIRPRRLERGRSGLDLRGRGRQGWAPEGVPARERLPEHDSGRPDVTRRPAALAAEALRGYVGERPRNVAVLGQRVGALELRESEVEQPHRHLLVL